MKQTAWRILLWGCLCLTAPLLALPLKVQANPAWPTYPTNLPQFDYRGDKLHHDWPVLTRGLHIGWPSKENLTSLFTAYPELKPKQSITDMGKYAANVQQVFRDLFEGHFNQARERGLTLGPVGEFAAYYAVIYQASYLVSDRKIQEIRYKEAVATSKPLISSLGQGMMASFGNAFAKLRFVEPLSMTASLRTGYPYDIKEQLLDILHHDPNKTLAWAMLGGFYAGSIEKSGRLMAKVGMGASKDKMNQAFEFAMQTTGDLPVVPLEYAKALLKLNLKGAREKAIELLQQAVQLTPQSAPEALDLRAAQTLLHQLTNKAAS